MTDTNPYKTPESAFSGLEAADPVLVKANAANERISKIASVAGIVWACVNLGMILQIANEGFKHYGFLVKIFLVILGLLFVSAAAALIVHLALTIIYAIYCLIRDLIKSWLSEGN